MEEEMCQKKLFYHDSKNPDILGLEHKLLEVASYENLTQAVFYMLPIEVTHQNDPKIYIYIYSYPYTHPYTHLHTHIHPHTETIHYFN